MPAAPSTRTPTTSISIVPIIVTSPYTIESSLPTRRSSDLGHVDFPPSDPVTLQPGAQYTYNASRTLSAGNYTAWPAYYDGTRWIELGPHTSFTEIGRAHV